MRLGVLSNEFFLPLPKHGGGFGWATWALSQALDPPEAFFISTGGQGNVGREVHERPLIPRRRLLATRRDTRRQRPTALMTIDYRDGYLQQVLALPRTPLLVWVRDPRPPEDAREIETLSIPGQTGVVPQDVDRTNSRTLGRVVAAAKLTGRRVVLASPLPELEPKLEGTYGVSLPLRLLPNPIPAVERGPRDGNPLVCYLGRLDPIKRPWIFVELARRMPDVRFVMAGRAHFTGPGAWEPRDLPPNLELVGHVDEAAKSELLSLAWVTVNTSIHEALAISFLESLAHEAPLLSLVDPGGVVSRYGIHSGSVLGDGLEGVDALVDDLASLLGDDGRRDELGRAGRAWVNSTHSRELFASTLRALHEELIA